MYSEGKDFGYDYFLITLVPSRGEGVLFSVLKRAYLPEFHFRSTRSVYLFLFAQVD
jgi:hypothetical protein